MLFLQTTFDSVSVFEVWNWDWDMACACVVVCVFSIFY